MLKDCDRPRGSRHWGFVCRKISHLHFLTQANLTLNDPRSSFPTTMDNFKFQAQGIQVFRDGNMCINCVGFDGTSRIGIFTPEGRKVHSFGSGVIGSTSAIAVDAMDRITVIDR